MKYPKSLYALVYIVTSLILPLWLGFVVVNYAILASDHPHSVCYGAVAMILGQFTACALHYLVKRTIQLTRKDLRQYVYCTPEKELKMQENIHNGK